ncbi:hypothetical protein F4679DRAFT_573008 [Xylaria curta]|nr:hypothetical protein F4679DRAFT_573008 [Xylaria curta]
MSVEATDALVAPAPELPALLHDNAPSPAHDGPTQSDDAKVADASADCADPHPSPKPIGLHSPPDSNNAMKLDGSDDDSELSDVEDPTLEPDQLPFLHAQPTPQPTAEPTPEDEDIGEVTPDHWSGTVPVFKPDMHQFKDFKKFMEKVDPYGMKSGIIKIIPPQEWKDKLPVLDDLVKQIRVREPIKQEIMGSNGTYRQVNILHQRAYNLPQWRQLCDQSEHQPPAKRGERRAQAPSRSKGTPVSTSSGPKRRSAAVSTSTSGRSTRSKTKRAGAKGGAAELEERPMTPVSPSAEAVIDSVEQDIGDDIEDDDPILPTVGRMGAIRQAKPKEQSTSARRKYARREGSAKIDEEAFKDFDYRMDISDYTPERCEDLERIYWKTLTYAPPLYGADVLGTLFDDTTESWNLNKLPNLLDVLGTKVPGVNTAYLYLGMWKATFAWHLEDVDLYSINYLHFGAPKQWYSISQGDARRFEAAMKSIWPTDAKACGQFLRHKAFLISPNHLQQYFNIKVNKCVSYPGEFVVTYPYGYHSGYNLGYNCAEAVNFALDSWLPMGKIAKKCECAQAQDSVWVDVYEIERKLRGEETEYEETEDEEEDDDDEEEEDELERGLPIPRSAHTIKLKMAGRKRKRTTADKGERKTKKIRLRLKSQVEPPCCLCPHDIPGVELLPTDNDRKAHRLCALYGAETWIETVDGKEVVTNVANISKARLDLKCLFCRSKRGTCFQCSHKKCARSYHATCAAAAGVFVEEAEVPIFGEDGTEYKEQAFEFSCRFHRTKRDRKLDGAILEDDQKTRRSALALKKGDICQLQYHRGEIFAGIIIENRESEQTFLLDIIPNGYGHRISRGKRQILTFSRERVEVEWKWLLLPDPADFHLPHASQNAVPMPTSRKAKDLINATRKRIEEPPRPEEPFVEGGFVWAEFNHHDLEVNKVQAKVDLSKENQIWYYLGRNSTDARPQYTEDPRKKQHNFPPPPPPRKSYGSTFSIHNTTPAPKTEKPYQYKPRDPFVPKPSLYTAQQFEPKPSPSTTFFHHTPPTNRPSFSTSSQSTPIPSPLPYYTFQHSYGPPGQQVQRVRQTPQTQPSTSTSQQRPQPAPYSTAQSATQTQPSQASMPRPATTFVSEASAQPACTPSVLPKQQSVSRRSSLQRPTPPQTASGHVRNKSSVSSHSGRLALGSGQRFGTPPSSYGHARGDSMTKSPFSHGFSQPPGLGPSPSPQNSQLFQTQARARSSSLVSNISLNTPMTSSAIRPSSSTSAQALAGHLQSVVVIQKYAFFQVHHNRDSTKYRTPYAHWGGFTNGYEGSLRAHLMRTPDALFGVRKPSTGLNGTNPGPSSSSHVPITGPLLSNSAKDDVVLHSQSPVAHHSSATTPVTDDGIHMPFSAPVGAQPAPSLVSHPSMAKESSDWHSNPVSSTSHWDSNVNAGAALHPAIRAHYAAMLQNRDVKVETHPDTGSMVPPLAMIPPLPTTPSAHTNSVKTAPAVTKQTHIPAPRPWEALRKSQTMPAQPVSAQSPTPASAITTASPTPMTPSPQALPGYSKPESAGHFPQTGFQPNHVVQSTGFRASPVRQPSPGAAPTLQPASPVAIRPPMSTDTATPHSPATISGEQPTPLPFPAVSDGSMELVESIIRNAQKASESFLGF